jgi:hypothetical protein
MRSLAPVAAALLAGCSEAALLGRAPPQIVVRGMDLVESMHPGGVSDQAYSYVCEATQPCDMPKASANDFFDAHIEVYEKDFQVVDGVEHRLRPECIQDCAKNLSVAVPAAYLIYYDATDTAGNAAKQVVIYLRVIDTVKPMLFLCGNETVSVEAGDTSFVMCQPTAEDNIDGDVTSAIHGRLFYNGNEHDFTDTAKIANHAGDWIAMFSVKDHSGNEQKAQQKFVVKPTYKPTITIYGANPRECECDIKYVDPGAEAFDYNGGLVPVRAYGGQRRSCMDIMTFHDHSGNDTLTSGFYNITRYGTLDTVSVEQEQIHRFNDDPTAEQLARQPGWDQIEVYCDFETDGGGYTYLKVEDGISTNKAYSGADAAENRVEDAANSCPVGMQMAVWRTKQHQEAMLRQFGTRAFPVVPGVYGTAGAVGEAHCVLHAMNSHSEYVSQFWKAIDGGRWFIRDTKAPQPNGDYQSPCLLGIFGVNPVSVNDDMCAYNSGTEYICSVNDKFGPGTLDQRREIGTPGSTGVEPNYPPKVPGDYSVVYQATNHYGVDADPAYRTVLIRDTLKPEIQTSRRETYVYLVAEWDAAFYLPALTTPTDGGTTFRSETECAATAAGAAAGGCMLWENAQASVPYDEMDTASVSCSDMCSQTTFDREWSIPLNPTKPGMSLKTYRCKDATQNIALYKRTWVFQDKFEAVLHLNHNATFVSFEVDVAVETQEAADAVTAVFESLAARGTVSETGQRGEVTSGDSMSRFAHAMRKNMEEPPDARDPEVFFAAPPELAVSLALSHADRFAGEGRMDANSDGAQAAQQHAVPEMFVAPQGGTLTPAEAATLGAAADGYVQRPGMLPVLGFHVRARLSITGFGPVHFTRWMAEAARKTIHEAVGFAPWKLAESPTAGGNVTISGLYSGVDGEIENGDGTYFIEAGLHKLYTEPGAKCGDTFLDNDGNLQWRYFDRMVRVTYPGGRVPDPTVPGVYEVVYNCQDAATGENAIARTRQVVVRDTQCVRTTVAGAQTQSVEAGNYYSPPRPGVLAWDLLDGNITDQVWTDGGTVDVKKAYWDHRSCAEIQQHCRDLLQASPALTEAELCPSGDYYIAVEAQAETHVGGGAWGANGEWGGQKQLPSGVDSAGFRRLLVHCDMHTDGGGYTEFAVSSGLRTAGAADADTCKQLGLQLVVPRTAAHFAAMLQRHGTGFFSIVPGIVGTSAAAATSVFATSAMSSDAAAAAAQWGATDGGAWFLRGSPLQTQVSDNAYTPGCYIGMTGWDSAVGYTYDYYAAAGSAGVCAYSDVNYVCSTNDKGGVGIDQPARTTTAPRGVGSTYTPAGTTVLPEDNRTLFPPGAEPGHFVITYHVRDEAGNTECTAVKRTVLVKDTLRPVLSLFYRNNQTKKLDKVRVTARVTARAGRAMTLRRAPRPVCVGALARAMCRRLPSRPPPPAAAAAWVLCSTALAPTPYTLPCSLSLSPPPPLCLAGAEQCTGRAGTGHGDQHEAAPQLHPLHAGRCGA